MRLRVRIHKIEILVPRYIATSLSAIINRAILPSQFLSNLPIPIPVFQQSQNTASTLVANRVLNGPGAPVGPHRVTTKSPGRDGTTKRGPFSSGKPQDDRHCQRRRSLQRKTISLGDYGGQRGSAGKGFLRRSIISYAKQK